jgi:hypothetical protein
MQKWLDQNTTSRSANPQSAMMPALQPRERLGAKRLLDDVERLRRRFWRVGLHGFGRRHRCIGIFRRLGRRFLGGDVHRDAVERQVPSSPVARLLDLELIVEHRLAECCRRRQPGHFEQHAVGAGKLGLDEAAGIGSGIDEITGCSAARAESESMERNQRGLRITGHRISLEMRSVYDLCEIITPFRMNPELKPG